MNNLRTTLLTICTTLLALLFSSNIIGQSLQQGSTYTFVSKNFPANCFHCEKDQHCDLKATKDVTDNALSQYKIVAGLDGGATVSFESIKHPGHYLRHQAFQLKLHTGTDDLFKKDASFKVVSGLADNQQVSFEAVNLAEHYIRHRGFKLFVEKTDNSDVFKADATFAANTVQQEAGKIAINTIYSFESMNFSDHYFQSYLGSRISKATTETEQTGASFHMVKGLIGPGTFSFHSVLVPGYYLLQEGNELVLQKLKLNDPAYDKKASFKIQDGLADPKLISFESVHQPDAYIRHRGGKLYVEKVNGDAELFKKDATFKVQAALSKFIPIHESLENMDISEADFYSGNAIHSFESFDSPNRHIDALGKIELGAPSQTDLKKAATSFRVIPGLDGQQTISLESIIAPGYYLSPQNTKVSLQKFTADATFKQSASFKIRKGLANDQAISFESISQPSYYIKYKYNSEHYSLVLVMAKSDGSDAFKKEATFKVSNGFLHSFVLPPNISAQNMGISLEDLYTGNAIYSFESFDFPKLYIETAEQKDYSGGYLDIKHIVTIKEIKTDLEKKAASFKVVPGLDGKETISIESVRFPGYYLLRRHSKFVWEKTASNNTDESSFKIHKGLAGDKAISFSLSNQPDSYIYHSNFKLHVGQSNGSEEFKKSATFIVRKGFTTK